MKTLMVGYKAADVRREDIGPETVFHELDIYHAHALEKVFKGVRTVCAAHLPEGPWDRICFKTGPKLMSGELAIDLMQECYALVNSGAGSTKFSLEYVGRERDRNELVDKLRDFPKRVRTFRAEWPASVPGGRKLMFASYPGCFCHRRLDEGGLALAEVVTRELANSPMDAVKLLDMGCGSGLVGLLIADYAKNREKPIKVDLTMIDSHTRAIEAAAENAAKFEIAAKCVLSDCGIVERADEGAFDIFVGNPPYYSDYRIADVFLETARKSLKPGGVCYSVCKNAAGLKPVQEKYFPEVETIARRGYAVLKSRKPQ